MIFELWHSEEEYSYLYLARNENYVRSIEEERKFTPDMKLIWEYDAKSYIEAMQARNKFLGWGKYKHEPDWEDIFYD